MTSPEPNTADHSVAQQHIRGSALLMCGRFLSLGINLVNQVVIVRYLSKHDFGAFAFALAIVMTASEFATFGLKDAASRFIPIYQQRRDYARMFGGMLLMSGTIIGLSTALLVLGFGLQGLLTQWADLDPLSLALLMTLIVLMPIEALDRLLLSLFAVFAGARGVFLRRHLLGPILRLGALLAVVAFSGNVHALAFAYVAAGALGVVLYVTLLTQILRKQGLLREFHLRDLRIPVREVFAFSLPLLGSQMFLVLRGTLVVFLLGLYHNNQSVAEYRAVVPVALLTTLVLRNFQFLFLPNAARLYADGEDSQINHLYWQTAAWIAVFTFPIFAVCVGLAEPVTALLFGERYVDSAVILAILALGYYFRAALGFNQHTLKVYGKAPSILAVDALSVIVIVGVNLMLIPKYGAMGGAIGTTSTIIVHNVLNQIALGWGTSVTSFNMKYARVYGAIVVCTVLLCASQWLWQPPFFVGGLLAAAGSLVVLMASRGALEVEETFPELRRLPFLKWIVASGRNAPVQTGTGTQQNSLKSIRDAAQHTIAARFKERAHRYFDDFDGRPVRVGLSGVQVNRASTVYEFLLSSGDRSHAVIAKFRPPWRSERPPVPSVDRPAINRPWVDRETTREIRSNHEYEALSAIHARFAELDPTRFTVVRPLDVFSDVPALISDKFTGCTLNQRYRRQRYARNRRVELSQVFFRAGEWLRHMHQMPVVAHTRARDTTRDEFVAATHELARFLSSASGCQRMIRETADECADLASRELPDRLPCGLLHGDFAPRNLLTDSDGRVAGFDTLAEGYGPVYEDIACFLVLLERDSASFYSLACGRQPKLDTPLRNQFLRGYFGDDPVPYGAVRLFEIQVAFEKWSQSVVGYRMSSRIRKIPKRARLGLINQSYSSLVQSLLRDLRNPERDRSNGYTPSTRSALDTHGGRLTTR
ncbi:MAG: hypothetical protein DWQ34_21380 [Planctomycetota bacterium]|nr:MAG: hypothetical protein DWQ34_21380 [Planctomycetota bacterium]REK29478.1 MAG: hypothetical protein DWQ41_04175 [Planctomycetota bacterium]REK31843.1 MAG: hypothetical protein DWQ45_18425 [Planctomycetota bacterium]